MRFRTFNLAVLLLALAGAAQPLRAQSLADLARQEAERRKTVKDNGKVYTNSDLGGAPASASGAATPAAADAAKDGKDAPAADDKGKDKDDKDKDKDAAAAGDKAKDQKYWADRAKELRTQLDRDQTYADALQTQINSLTTDFVNHDDPAQRSVIAQNRQKSLDELSRLKQAIEDDKKAISDLEEEARRASVPPGWLR